MEKKKFNLDGKDVWLDLDEWKFKQEWEKKKEVEALEYGKKLLDEISGECKCGLK